MNARNKEQLKSNLLRLFVNCKILCDGDSTELEDSLNMDKAMIELCNLTSGVSVAYIANLLKELN
jgi:hypothetical protein